MEPGNIGNQRTSLSLTRGQQMEERAIMTNRLLMSAAAIALLAGTSVASAQGAGGSAGGSAGGASGGAAATQSAPSGERGGSATTSPMQHDAAPTKGTEPGMKSTQSDEKMAPGGAKNRAAQDTSPGQKSTTSSDSRDSGKMGKDAKDGNRNAETKRDADTNRNADSKTGSDSRSATTTGQAGAGAKLNSEQRTKITTVIKQQNIQPVTNVNFSVSVGTRVPRDVGFHPLPTEIISVYPDWRGYEFFLVGDQIVVVNPRSMEIVAVLDA
jgi:hypothetical protein